jgi:hypothetical protein
VQRHDIICKVFVTFLKLNDDLFFIHRCSKYKRIISFSFEQSKDAQGLQLILVLKGE